MPEKDRRSSDVFIGMVQDKSLTSGHVEGSVSRVLVIVCGVAECICSKSGQSWTTLEDKRPSCRDRGSGSLKALGLLRDRHWLGFFIGLLGLPFSPSWSSLGNSLQAYPHVSLQSSSGYKKPASQDLPTYVPLTSLVSPSLLLVDRVASSCLMMESGV